MKRFYMISCLVVFLLININTSVLGESLTQWEPTEKTMHSLVKDGYKIVGVTDYQGRTAHFASRFVLQKGESVFSCSCIQWKKGGYPGGAIEESELLCSELISPKPIIKK